MAANPHTCLNAQDKCDRTSATIAGLGSWCKHNGKGSETRREDALKASTYLPRGIAGSAYSNPYAHSSCLSAGTFSRCARRTIGDDRSLKQQVLL